MGRETQLLVICILDSGASGLGSYASRGHCIVFLGEVFDSHSLSPDPGVHKRISANRPLSLY